MAIVNKFDPYVMQKHLPRSMRFKEVWFPEPRVIYWVTHGIFNEEDLKTFQEAFKEYGGFKDKAYIAPYPKEGRPYLHNDLEKGRVAIVTKDKIIADDYLRTMFPKKQKETGKER